MNNLNTRSKGKIGEDVACIFLEKKGFTILERNYQKKWGEIDIIAKKASTVHFFEVKSVTVVFDSNPISQMSHTPEENVHSFKTRQIRRMIQTYLAEQGMGPESTFSFHVLCVYLDMNKKQGRVKWMKDLVI